MTGVYIDKFDYDTVHEAYKKWATLQSKAEYCSVIYELYHYGKLASVPVDATAFAHRNEVRLFALAPISALLTLDCRTRSP